jgi:hypothetical protein
MSSDRGRAKSTDATAIIDDDDEIARDHRCIADAKLSGGDARGERAG